MSAKNIVRCAIYTRQAVAFPDRIEAQRTKAEACIAARAADGLVALPERYDDLGQSGNTADRPALNRLMRAVEAGAVDCIVTDEFWRLARDETIRRELRDHLNRYGVRVIVASIPPDLEAFFAWSGADEPGNLPPRLFGEMEAH